MTHTSAPIPHRPLGRLARPLRGPVIWALTLLLSLACAEAGTEPGPGADAPEITTVTLPNGVVGTPYSQVLTVSASDGPLTWSLIGGALPPGLTFNAAVPSITGTPTTAGTYSFTIQVQRGSETASRTLSISVTGGAPVITTTSLPSAVVGVAYTQTLVAAGGDGRYAWALTLGGQLPAGLTLNPGTGVISGTPTIAGGTSFTVQVTSAGQSATRPFSITVNATGPSITTTTLPAAVLGATYLQQLAATGGDGTYAWALAGGSLPAGLALNASTGTIAGTPTAAGTSTFTVQLSSGGQTSTRSLSITVTVGAGAPVIVTTSLPGGMVGEPYSQILSASGGVGGYTWTITGGGLPFGLSLNAATGAITGAPIAGGSYPFIVQVTSGGQTASRQLSIVINATPPSVTTASLPNAVIGTVYSQTLSATGGEGNYTWAITGGALPAGLSLNAAIGSINGTPTAAGTASFTVQVTSAGQTGSRALTIQVNASGPVITTATLPGGVVGSAYSQTLAAAGGTAAYSWAITTGTLPAGLALNPTSGAITGTPTTAGTSTFTAQVTSGGQSNSRVFSITISTPPAITTSSLPSAVLGAAYNQTLAASGGSGPYSWAIVGGALPAGLSLNAATGAITGAPTAVGVSSFAAQVTSGGQSSSRTLSIVVNASAPSIVTTTLPNAVVGSAYSQTLAATGGDGSYHWSIANGSLPAGLSLNGAAGVISGTPTTAGTATFTLEVSSAFQTAGTALSIVVNASGPVITTASLPGASVGTPYNQTLAATGGASYSWAITSGALPAGLSLGSASGTITGTPTTAGTASFTVQVTSGGQSNSRAFTLTVSGNPPVITTTSLPSGMVGSPYSQTLGATGGTGSYSWTMAGGALPAGLSLNGSTGVISGTPTTSGVASFNVLVTSGGQSGLAGLSIVINATAPDVTTTSLPSAVVGTAYNQSLAARGGDGRYEWAIVGGTLPTGLSLNGATGAITGTPTTVGTSTFTVEVTSAGQTGTQSLSITVQASGPVITTATLPSATVGTPYSQTVVAIGGGGPNSWAIIGGALPVGLTLNATSGAITGTPTVAGSASFTVQVTSAGRTDTRAFTVAVNATAPVITTSSLPAGLVGTAYSQTLAATGGDGSYSWAISGGALPAGLTLNAATGVISGTPTASGTASFTVQVASGGQSSTRTLSIAVGATAPVITTASLGSAGVGVAYNQTLTATGGGGTYSWAIVGGALPAGLTLTGSTGVISGTPTASGTASFTVQVTSGGQTATRPLSIVVSATTPVVITSSLPGATLGVSYSQTLAAAGGTGTYSWAVTAGTLPAGLSLATGTGVISGTPTALGTSSFTVQVTSGGQSGTQPLSITVAATALAITTSSLPGGLVGTPYNQTLTATGGAGGYSWSIASGGLPAGLSLNPATGAITGTPSAFGTASFTAQVTSAGQTVSRALSIPVNASAPAITTTSLPAANVGTAYGQTLTASGGDGSYSWTIVGGSLPSGLSLNASTGAITGTPTSSGTSSFTVQLTSAGQSVTRALSIAVSSTAPVITTSSLPSAVAGSGYSQALAATGGSGSYSWAIVSGALPAGLSLNNATGVIAGTPTSSGTASFTVRVTSGGQSSTRALSLTVNASVLAITTSSLPAAAVGSPYGQLLAATGGDGSYSWSVVVGSLPAGLALDETSGAITGAPAVSGTSGFTVEVTSGGQVTSRPLSITVSASGPVITTASLPGGVVGSPYSQTLTATGGAGAYSWLIVGGSLPAGLALNAGTGAITGTPTLSGAATFTVQVSSGGQTDSQMLSIVVTSTATRITTASLPNGTVGAAYSQTLAATGGDGSYSWAIVGGALPAGLSLNAGTGAITGTPSAAGTAGFTVQATSGGSSDAHGLSITIGAGAGSPPNITTSSLPSGVVGVAYSQTLTVTGGSGSYSWAVVGGSLPAGLALNASTGAITGTPTTAGTPGFTLQVTSAGQTDAQALSIAIYSPVNITMTSLPPGVVGFPYLLNLTATGGTGTYTWSVVSGSLPSGFALDPTTGVLSGTTTTTGSTSFTVRASSAGLTDTQAYTLTRYNPVLITTSSLPGGAVGQPYSQSLAATGGTGAFTWSIAAGSLPPGLSLNPSTGAITGTPTAGTLAAFTVLATSAGIPGSKQLLISTGSSGGAEPGFDPGTQRLVMADNMDQYSTAAAMGLGGAGPRIIPNPSPAATSQPVNTNFNELIAPGRGGAGKALRMLYDGQYQSGSNFETLNTASLTDNNDTHYFQHWARVTYPGGSAALDNRIIAIKWLMAWHRVRSGTRIQWETHDGFPCNAGPGGSDPLPFDTYWGVFDQAETGCQAFQPVGPFFYQIADGNWHRFTYEFKPNTSVGSRDGVARMWVDGTKIIDVSAATCGVTPPGGLKPWCALDDLDALAVADGIVFLRWGGPHTGVAVQPWTYDIDDFTWWVTP